MVTAQRLLLACLFACLPAFLDAADKESANAEEAEVFNPARSRGEVGENERIKFGQDQAEAHMRELEGRMFKLSELLREAQPEDADRLLLGLRKAKEQLIADQMSSTSELLASLKLDRASNEQKEIIEKLEELKRLLLTSDISLQIKLEQLRNLLNAKQQLEQLIRKETTQHETTERVDDEKATKEEFDALETAEHRNERSGEDLEQALRQLGQLAAPAAGSVNGATQDMSAAGSALGQMNSGDASTEQSEALEKLNRAAAQIAEAERDLKAELEALVRQQVMENVVEMIAQQMQVREITEKLSPRVADRQRQAILSIRHLADAEDRILALAEESIDLCVLTEFSLAFPPALEAVADIMELVSENLQDARADETVIADERQIESDLKDLLDALKQASRPQLGNQNNAAGLGLRGNANKLLGELKMVRWMQKSLHGQTITADRLLAEQKIDANQQRKRTEPLSGRQSEIRDLTEQIQLEYSQQNQ
ncbi:MAG: hypothetical protein R3B91_09510 [Planctomycetaceae bacterium]